MAVVKDQYSTGDQSGKRQEFWASGMKTCPECKSDKGFDTVHDVCGVRHNGDAYGVDVFTCKNCGWKTSFQWDEAGDGAYYYETQWWSRT